MRRWLLLFVFATPVLLSGQTPKPLTFEVASIKESTDIVDGGSMRLMPDGGVVAKHLPARSYLTIAFSLQQYQVVNAPAWMATTYYDIQAKPAAQATREQRSIMLQSLLRDRFHLQFHREQRPLDGYAMLPMRVGQLGPRFQRSSVDCGNAFATTPRCREGGFDSNGTFRAIGVPLYQLVQIIVVQVQAPVIDQTRLDGPFDIDLRWSPDLAKTDDAPSIFTALQEQLGLKLERRRLPTEMFVIDHVEKPTPD